MNKVGVVLLAAGQSRRFGRQKLLFPLRMDSQRPEQPMLGWTIETIQQITDQLLVVVDAQQTQVIDYLDALKVEYVVNPQAQLGLGGSLACGIQAVKDRWDAAMIALGDMPFIQPESYQALLKAALPYGIVVPETLTAPDQRKRGNPVVFGQAFFDGLMSLNQDQGGRDIVRQHQDAVINVLLDDPGVLQDVDQPDDLLNLTA